MHVLVNGSSARLGGGITVLKNLLPALCAVDGGRHRYTVLARGDVLARLQGEAPDPRVRWAAPPPGLARLGRPAWEQLLLPAVAVLGRADVVFCPANLGLLASPAPQVLMIQNVAPFDPDVLARYPRAARVRFELLRALTVRSARRAAKVVFISDWARSLLAPLFGLPEGRCARVHLGRDPAFAPEAAARAGPLLERLGVRSPYVLSVGQFYAYKNLVELVVAFARARGALPPGTQLVLAGEEHEPEVARAVRAAIAREGLGEHVRLLGQVPYAELPPLYAAARLFVFPSACENFPNILVEAMAAGAPTLASSLGPMPEVAGDGARYADPFDPDALAAGMVALTQDEEERQALRARGLARAARYSWEETARGLLAALEAAGGAA